MSGLGWWYAGYAALGVVTVVGLGLAGMYAEVDRRVAPHPLLVVLGWPVFWFGLVVVCGPDLYRKADNLIWTAFERLGRKS